MIALTEIVNAYPLEQDSTGEFVWARDRFSFPHRGVSYGLLRACYHGRDGRLSIRLANGACHNLELFFGWHDYLIPFGEIPGPVTCTVSPVVPCEQDSRTLGLMIRSIDAVTDLAAARRQLDRGANQRKNQAEYEAGVAVLRSIPPQLRTSLETKCNVFPRCAYCHWDYAKDLETRLDFELGSVETLEQLGEFTRLATEVHDCSWGEVFVNRSFPETAEYLFRTGLHCSFTSNGMLMTEEKYAPLLGQRATLYVSLDASDAERFSRYRNFQFGDVVRNVRRLCDAKKAHGNKPEVHIVCVAMTSNFEDIPNVVDLTAELGADGFFLQALHDQNMSRPDLVVQNGYEFDYEKECLDLARLQALSEGLRARAEALGLTYRADTTDYCRQNEKDSDVPLCSEPWKTVYPVSRGITPCCFGREPIASWDERGDTPLDEFIQKAINNPAMQEIRTALAKRELSDYCRRCTSCPVTKRYLKEEATQKK